MKQKTWLKDLGLAVLLCGGFLLLADRIMPFYFALNDDTTMISILNGSYSGTPDGHAIFIGYLLGWLISRLYATGITLCWYKWALIFSNLLGMVSVLYRLYRRFPERKLLCSLSVLGLTSVLWLPQMVCTTYTVCSAFVLACTILSYAIQPKDVDTRPGYLVNILLLFVLAFELRDYFGYLAIPFLGVLWLGKHWGELRSNRACWLVPIAGACCFLLAFGSEQLAYSGPWSDYIAYNDARSYLQDYDQFPDYDEHQAFLQELGFSKAEYRTLSRHDYCLLEDFQPGQMIAVSDYAKTLEPHVSFGQVVKKAIRRASDCFFISSLSSLTPLRFASYLSPFVLLFSAVMLSVREHKQYWVTSLLILFGSACLWLIIGYQGRTPDRVIYSLRLITTAACTAGCAVLFSQHPIHFSSRNSQRILSGILCASMLLLCLYGGVRAHRESGGHASKGDYLIYAAQHPDELFVRDIKSTVVGSRKYLEFPRPPVNMLSSGGWAVYSPVYQNKLDALGIPAVNRSLLLQDNVYLLVDLDSYQLSTVLGVSKKAQISYDVVKVFDGNLSMISIHSITEP